MRHKHMLVKHIGQRQSNLGPARALSQINLGQDLRRDLRRDERHNARRERVPGSFPNPLPDSGSIKDMNALAAFILDHRDFPGGT